jgi:beta-barrel assembly-enhancing protease
MKKTIAQGAIIIGLFFLTWIVLQQINWIKLFKVRELTDKTEQKTGDFIWETIQKTEKENREISITRAIDSIADKICFANNIERKMIKVHVVNKPEINAFALPNGHLVVYTGLILASDNQDELTGVIGHELAHIQLNHVMKKLVKEVGLSVLVSMTVGKNDSKISQEIAKMLSSSAFDRSLEKDADLKAVDYLIKAKINPEPFANFLYKLSGSNGDTDKYLSWINTHPESKERASYIIEYCKGKSEKFEKAISDATWSAMQQQLASTNNTKAEESE